MAGRDAGHYPKRSCHIGRGRPPCRPAVETASVLLRGCISQLRRFPVTLAFARRATLRGVRAVDQDQSKERAARLGQGAVEVISAAELAAKLAEGRPLRVKLGMDP